MNQDLIKNDRPKLLVTAYAFSPYKGSEFAQGWNYVQYIKEFFDVTVLVGSSDGGMGETTVAEELSKDASLGFDIVVVPAPKIHSIVKFLDNNFRLGWFFVISLDQWHKKAAIKAKELHRERRFDLTHQLGPIGFRNPGYSYEIGIPSYWGPIGGCQYINLRLAFKSNWLYGFTSLIRNLLTKINSKGTKTSRAINGYDRVSFATANNRDILGNIYGVKGPIISDQACSSSCANIGTVKQKSKRVVATWCGSVDARKNINLLIDIAFAVKKADLNVFFNVLGEGSLLSFAKRKSSRLELDNISFEGHVTRESVQKSFDDSDVLIFTSLSEANTSTFFEAVERNCLPIALDIDGFSENIFNNSGYKVSADQPYASIIEDYVKFFSLLESDLSSRETLRENLNVSIDSLSWKSLGSKHKAILDDLLSKTGA